MLGVAVYLAVGVWGVVNLAEGDWFIGGVMVTVMLVGLPSLSVPGRSDPAPGASLSPCGKQASLLRALRGLVQDGAVAACGLGLVEGGVGGEQRVVVRGRARVDEDATDADGGVNPAGAGGV